MQRVFIEERFRTVMTITGSDARHIVKVLRMQRGDCLQVVCDDGTVCVAQIVSGDEKKVQVSAVEILREAHESSICVTLAQGLVKADKMDFVIQKAVELGVNRIIPLILEHSIVRLTEERSEKKLRRWQEIALGAAQQSKRDLVPVVEAVQSLDTVLNGAYDLILVAYENEMQVSLKSVLRGRVYKNVLVIIGPEGGLREDEVEKIVKKGGITVSLGRRILRSETAGLVVLSCIYYEGADQDE